jgi:hypothetical protein
MSIAMTDSVRVTLDDLGVRKVAAAAGIPFWTLRKWRDANCIPGKGAAQEMRRQLLEKGIKKVRAAKRQRKAAA